LPFRLIWVFFSGIFKKFKVAKALFFAKIIFSFGWGYVKSIFPPAAAEYYIKTALGSLILLRKINEPSAVSNDYLARSAVKRLFIRQNHDLGVVTFQ
jgi:hypothetical protein